MNNLVKIIALPGTGTHMLLDIAARFDIAHTSMGFLVYNICCEKKFGRSTVAINNQTLYSRVIEELEDVAINNSSAISDTILNLCREELEQENLFLLQPHAHYLHNVGDLGSWTEAEIVAYDEILTLVFERAGYGVSEFFYLREPACIFDSLKSRFEDDSWNDNIAVSEIRSFFNLNKTRIDKFFTYEELACSPLPTVKNLLRYFDSPISEHEIADRLKPISFHKPRKCSNISYQLFKDIQYKYNPRGNRTNTGHVFSTIERIGSEFQNISRVCFWGDFRNDAALNRHRVSFLGRAYKTSLCFVPRCRRNWELFKNRERRIGAKNIWEKF